MAEADWSKLPEDILILISKRLQIDIDLLSFRSVCSHWRTSSINRHNTLQIKLPLLKYKIDRYNFRIIIDNTSSFSYLSKRSHFLIKPSQQDQDQDQTLVRPPWLILITQNSFNKTMLFHPQFSYSLSSHYFRLTQFDFSKLSVIHLGTDFIVDDGDMHPKKIIAVTHLVQAVLLDNNRLVLFHCGDNRWIEIPDMSSSYVGDICIFNGRIYAIQVHGRKTVAIGPEDLSVQLVANPGGMGGTRLMVESEGELLLVELLSVEDALTINLFRLNEFMKKWVKLTSLGKRILFLGNGGSFSVSASNLSVAKGNCVIFMVDGFGMDKICNNASGMYVFDLDQGRILPLSDYPDYLNLFWPPPEWIVKSYMHEPKKRVTQRKRT